MNEKKVISFLIRIAFPGVINTIINSSEAPNDNSSLEKYSVRMLLFLR